MRCSLPQVEAMAIWITLFARPGAFLCSERPKGPCQRSCLPANVTGQEPVFVPHVVHAKAQVPGQKGPDDARNSCWDSRSGTSF